MVRCLPCLLAACSPLLVPVPAEPPEPFEPGLVVTGPDGRPTCDGPFDDPDLAAARAGVACGTADVAWTDGAAYPTLQEAIDAAPDGGLVLVCPGTHGRHAEIVRKDLHLTSASGSADDTVLSEPGAILTVERAAVTVSDLTLAGGVGDRDGGAIHHVDGSLRLERVVLEGNHGAQGGAVVFDGHVLVTQDVTFLGNTAANGGALYVKDAECVALADTTFVANQARRAGGAVYVARATDVLVVGATFERGVAGTTGGALHFAGARLAVHGVTFRQDVAGTAGGAIRLDGRGHEELRLTGSSFEDGTAGSDGGAISVDGTGPRTLALSDATFLRNAAGGVGGALATSCPGDVALTVERASFTDGSAADGAAIHLAGRGTVDAVLSDTTFDGNVADAGSAALVVEVRGFVQLDGVDFGTNAPGDVSTPCGAGTVGDGVRLTCDHGRGSSP